MKSYLVRLITLVFLFTLLQLPRSGAAAPSPEGLAQEPSPQALIAELRQAVGDQFRLSRHRETGNVRFLGGTPAQALTPAVAGLGAEVTPEVAARDFLSSYGKLFGLADADRDLAVKKERKLDDGRTFVRFQQTHQGVPIIGAELVVQMGRGRQVISASGEILSDLPLETTPAVDAATARQTALAKVAKEHGLSPTDVTSTEPELWIYNPSIMGGPGPQLSRLVWRMEVTPRELLPINEFVLVDAQLGAVALQFNQIHTAKNRKTYTANNSTSLPGTLVCDETDPTCSAGDTHAEAAHKFAGDTYDFYMNEHGRDGIDGSGLTIVSTVHYGSNYENAFWDGAQMVYGDGAGFPLADDVVAHELTHGVTDYTSELFYFYQSGAINESLSDVWGEFIDQAQATGNDTGDARWEMGEDVAGWGAIRDMSDPPRFSQPDMMSSPDYYCGQSDLFQQMGDNGGVHYNSGVNNKAVYLMTDGGSFNGHTVAALGISKVAALYYEVQTNMLFSAADYADLYDALIQASVNLGFSAAEQAAVKNALDAVEMNDDPAGCPAPEAPVCTSGTPVNVFFDDLESGGSNWQSGTNLGTAYWFAPHSTQNIGLPGPYATSGKDNIWGFAQGWNFGTTSDTYLMMKNDVTLPNNAYLHFNHSFGFESNGAGTTFYDGGVLEYSTDGGGTWQDTVSLFTHNGYNATLFTTSPPDNPLGGRDAFGGDSRGYISSRVNLSSLAGEDVRFRFRIGTDAAFYDFGWFIDDVRVYTCGPAGNTAPTISGVPDRLLNVDESLNNAIDLWAYASDAQDADADLAFTIANTPDADAGVTIDSNRYVDINPSTGWTGTTQVVVQVEDTEGLTDSDSFQITVTGGLSRQYLPIIMSN